MRWPSRRPTRASLWAVSPHTSSSTRYLSPSRPSGRPSSTVSRRMGQPRFRYLLTRPRKSWSPVASRKSCRCGSSPRPDNKRGQVWPARSLRRSRATARRQARIRLSLQRSNFGRHLPSIPLPSVRPVSLLLVLSTRRGSKSCHPSHVFPCC